MKTLRSDSEKLSQLLNEYYLEGTFTGDVGKLDELYNSNTLLFGDVKGQPYAKTVQQYLEGVKNRQSPKDSGRPFNGEILQLKVINSIAIAELKVTMYDFIYHVFLSFHKINDKWVIVNKMLTDTKSKTEA